MKSNSEKLQCKKCLKKYSQERSLAVHLKTKHRDDQKSEKYQSLKLKICSETFLEAEEEIFLFLSELSHKYAYSLETLVTLKLYDPNSHSTGKNHFVINSILKNPFECQDPEEEMTEKIKFLLELNKVSKDSQNQIFINDIQQLNSVLEQEYTKWYFADPYEDSIDFNEEFTLDDVLKLTKNILKRKIELNCLPICIFVLWMGKYLKKEPFIDLWKMVCFAESSGLISRNQFESEAKYPSKNENKQTQMYSQKVLDDEYQKLKITFSKQEFEKWVQLYGKWHEKISTLIDIFKGRN